MAAKTFAEALGAGHRIKKVFASDGTVRKIKKIYASTGGVAKLVFSAEDDLSMVVGTSGATNAVGFAAGGFGSMTPNTLSDGAIVQELAIGARLSPTPNQLIFQINGYPGTITEFYLTSLAYLGTSVAPGDANFTGFSGGAPGGSAFWEWQNAGIPTVGATVPVVVVRS